MIDLSFLRDVKIPIFTSSLPRSVKYPFVLTHIDCVDRDRWHIENAHRVIIDINVHRFRKVGDYPLNTLLKYYYVVRSLARRYRDKIIAVLPDLPWDDDYFRGTRYIDNVRKTVMYHVMFMRKLKMLAIRYGIWIIPVVQHMHSIDSLRYCAEHVKDIVDYLSTDVYAVGVGSLCVSRSIYKMLNMYYEVRKQFPNHRIHLFGVTIRVLDVLSSERVSIDSTGWTRPADTKLQKVLGQRKRRSCYNDRERVLYFLWWIYKALLKQEQYTHAHEVLEIFYKTLSREQATTLT